MENIAANENVEQRGEKILFTLTSTMPLAIALMAVIEKAERFGHPIHSVEYTAEELLSKAVVTRNNYLDADKDRRNAVLCEKEINALSAPPPLDLEDIDSLTKNAQYAERVKGLRRKYGIGSEKKSL